VGDWLAQNVWESQMLPIDSSRKFHIWNSTISILLMLNPMIIPYYPTLLSHIIPYYYPHYDPLTMPHVIPFVLAEVGSPLIELPTALPEVPQGSSGRRGSKLIGGFQFIWRCPNI
jgi:hypothetical protein